MMTRQQLNDYLIQRTEQQIKDNPDLEQRLFWDYRSWVLSLIRMGKDQLASKPTSDSNGANAGGGGQSGGGEGTGAGSEEGGQNGEIQQAS